MAEFNAEFKNAETVIERLQDIRSDDRYSQWVSGVKSVMQAVNNPALDIPVADAPLPDDPLFDSGPPDVENLTRAAEHKEDAKHAESD